MGTVRRPTALLVAAALAVATAAGTGPPASADPGATPALADGAPGGGLGLAELRQRAADHGSVPVLVAVSDDAGGDPAAVVAEELAGTTSAVRLVGDGLVAVEADPAGLDRLSTAAVVEAIGGDPLLRLAAVPASGPPLRAEAVHPLGLTGAGRNVAVVDTGVDTSHPAFAGAVVAEACFVEGLRGACPDGSPRQVGPGAGTPCTVDADGCGHGTHVAGIALGRAHGSQPAGIAPGAGLISVRIFGADPIDPGAVAARTSDLIAALEHLRDLNRTTPIDAINLSLSGRLYGGGCDSDATDLSVAVVSQLVAELRAAGVATVSATGNEGNPLQISFPACLSTIVPVAATDAADAVAAFSNRNPAVRLAAPGLDIASAAVGGGTEVRSGTSMAAPQVSGAIALLRQRYTAPDVTWLLDRLEATGRRLSDPGTGLALHRIEAPPALGLAEDPAGGGVKAAGAWVVTDRGRVLALGQARHHGDSPTLPAGERVVAASASRSGLGYWLTTDRGRVLGFGDAPELGDARALPLNRPITAMAPTTTGQGYWLLGGDGGVFSYGDARFHGSTGAMTLNAPVSDLTVTPSGGGYWLVALDGGVFSFGDAPFHGSTGSLTLNRPVVSIAAGPRTGYWLVALDGGVFAFGVPFLGSVPGTGEPGTGYRIRSSAEGRAYHILTSDGRARPFGLADGFGPAPIASGERPVDLIVVP